MTTEYYSLEPEDLNELMLDEVLREITSPVDALLESVRLAASELEQQGEKSDRIATQLLTALAKFAQETGRP